MTFNPFTRRLAVGLEQFAEVRRAEAGAAAATVLRETGGKLPINARGWGRTKVFAYHLANFLSVGIVGQVGATCSRLSCMGTVQNSFAKTLGQLHLNATQDCGRFVNNAAKIWTHVVGFIPGHLLGVGFVLDAKMLDPAQKYVNHFKEQGAERPFTAHRFKEELGVGDLGNMKNFAKPFWRKIKDELAAAGAEANQRNGQADNPPDKDAEAAKLGARVETALITGSQELRSAFIEHLSSEYKVEAAMFYQWSKPEVDKLDSDPNYGLSKYELVVAHENFIRHDSVLELDGPLDALDQKITQTLSQDYIEKVKRALKELNAAEADIKKARANPLSGREMQVKLTRLQQARQEIERLKTGNDARLTPEASRELLPDLKSVHSRSAEVLNKAMARFGARVGRNWLEIGGYDPVEVKKAKVKIETQRKDLISSFTEQDVAEDTAKAIVNDLFAELNDASERDRLKPGFIDGKLAEIEKAAPDRLKSTLVWMNVVQKLRDRAEKTMLDLGLPDREVKEALKGWFEPTYINAPATHFEAQSKLEEIEKEFDVKIKRFTESLQTKPPLGLVPNGETQRLVCSKEAKQALAKKVNEDLKNVLGSPDAPCWIPAEDTENEGVFQTFAKDCMRAKFTVDDIVIADPDDETTSPEEKMAQCKKNLMDAGIPKKDIAMLTAALHHGLGADMQSLSIDPDTRYLAPTQLLFSHENSTKEHKREGDGLSIEIRTNEDGTYDFTFKNQGALSTVTDSTQPVAEPFRTDPSRSWNTLSLSGKLDPRSSTLNWLTFDRAAYSYSAVAQSARHRHTAVRAGRAR